jgi:hypothetical protein
MKIIAAALDTDKILVYYLDTLCHNFSSRRITGKRNKSSIFLSLNEKTAQKWAVFLHSLQRKIDYWKRA